VSVEARGEGKNCQPTQRNGFRIKAIADYLTPNPANVPLAAFFENGITGPLSVGLTLVEIRLLAEPGLAFGTFGNRSGTICTTAPS
jgi:hypothetical protein